MKEIASILFLAFLILAGTINQRPVLPAAILLAAIIGGFFARYIVERQRHAQLSLLRKQLALLEAGSPIHVGDTLVTKNSKLTSYQLRIGAIFFSIEFRSPYRIHPDPSQSEAVTYSLITLLTGWFSLPFGPLSVIAIILQNFRGGETVGIMDLVGVPEREIANEGEKDSVVSGQSKSEATIRSTDKSGPKTPDHAQADPKVDHVPSEHPKPSGSPWSRIKPRVGASPQLPCDATSFGSTQLNKSLLVRTSVPEQASLPSTSIGKHTVFTPPKPRPELTPSPQPPFRTWFGKITAKFAAKISGKIREAIVSNRSDSVASPDARGIDSQAETATRMKKREKVNSPENGPGAYTDRSKS